MPHLLILANVDSRVVLQGTARLHHQLVWIRKHGSVGFGKFLEFTLFLGLPQPVCRKSLIATGFTHWLFGRTNPYNECNC